MVLPSNCIASPFEEIKLNCEINCYCSAFIGTESARIAKCLVAAPFSDTQRWMSLIILRSAALILLVIATIQLLAPEIMKLIREIIEWFP